MAEAAGASAGDIPKPGQVTDPGFKDAVEGVKISIHELTQWRAIELQVGFVSSWNAKVAQLCCYCSQNS